MPDIKQFEPLWGVWRTEELIGRGSYGRVYRAVREEFGKKYYSAIKHISIPEDDSQIDDIIAEGLASDSDSAGEYFRSATFQLIDEISLMNEVKGTTNIVSYEDHSIVPRENGMGYDIFIRMELLKPLNSIIAAEPLPRNEIIKIGVDMCTALEACAERNIIHRDIKPSNIFVNDSGNYKLGDFGVARHLENATMGMSKKGTYAYMAPEVYRGEPASLTADIYSLGMVLYRLVNGNRPPFVPIIGKVAPGQSEAALVRRINGEPLPPPAYADPELANVLLMACAHDRNKRFRTPAAFKNALLSLKDAGDGEMLFGDSLSAASQYLQENSSERSDRLLSVSSNPSWNPAAAVPSEPSGKPMFVPPADVNFGDRTVAVRPDSFGNYSSPVSQTEIYPPGTYHPEAKDKSRSKALEKFISFVKEKSSLLKKASVIAAAAAVVIAGAVFGGIYLHRLSGYNKAVECLENGEFLDAYDQFSELGSFKDSQIRAVESMYQYGIECLTHANYDEAASVFEEIADDISDYSEQTDVFNDFDYRLNLAYYGKAEKLRREGYYEAAIDAFSKLDGFDDSEEKIMLCNYQWATELYNVGEWEKAYNKFYALGDYSDSVGMASKCQYSWGMELFNAHLWEDAEKRFADASGYSDSDNMWKLCEYYWGLDMYESLWWEEAESKFAGLGSGYLDCGAYIALCDYHEFKDSFRYNDDVSKARSVFKALVKYSSSNSECKAARADSCFTFMKLYGSEFSDGVNSFIIKKSDSGYTLSQSLWGMDMGGFWWSFDKDSGKYGTFQVSYESSGSLMSWFEVINFSDIYAEKPSTVSIKNSFTGSTAVLKRQ